MAAVADRRDRAPRGDHALGDELAADAAAIGGDEPVDPRVVGGAIHLGDVEPALRRRHRRDLPIAVMRRDEDGGFSGRDDRIEDVVADELDASIIAIDLEFLEMRVFGDDAAEIIPHPAHHKPRLGIAEIWQCALQIDLRALGDAEARTDEPAEPAADRRGGVDRQQTEETKHQPGADRLDAMGEVAGQPRPALRLGDGLISHAGAIARSASATQRARPCRARRLPHRERRPRRAAHPAGAPDPSPS